MNLSIDPTAAMTAAMSPSSIPMAGDRRRSSGFTVVAARSVTSLSPNARGQGAVSETIVITGANFRSGTWPVSAVSFSGSGITVTR